MSVCRRRVEDVDHWILTNSMRLHWIDGLYEKRADKVVRFANNPCILKQSFPPLLTGSEKGKHSHGDHSIVNPCELDMEVE
jgi:hypothetical protein